MRRSGGRGGGGGGGPGRGVATPPRPASPLHPALELSRETGLGKFAAWWGWRWLAGLGWGV